MTQLTANSVNILPDLLLTSDGEGVLEVNGTPIGFSIPRTALFTWNTAITPDPDVVTVAEFEAPNSVTNSDLCFHNGTNLVLMPGYHHLMIETSILNANAQGTEAAPTFTFAEETLATVDVGTSEFAPVIANDAWNATQMPNGGNYGFTVALREVGESDLVSVGTDIPFGYSPGGFSLDRSIFKNPTSMLINITEETPVEITYRTSSAPFIGSQYPTLNPEPTYSTLHITSWNTPQSQMKMTQQTIRDDISVHSFKSFASIHKPIKN